MKALHTPSSQRPSEKPPKPTKKTQKTTKSKPSSADPAAQTKPASKSKAPKTSAKSQTTKKTKASAKATPKVAPQATTKAAPKATTKAALKGVNKPEKSSIKAAPIDEGIAPITPDPAVIAAIQAFIKDPSASVVLPKVAPASAIDLSLSEPGIVLSERLTTALSPSKLWRLLRALHPRTQDLILDGWQLVVEAVPAGQSHPTGVHDAVARAYVAIQAQRAAKMLRDSFLEPGSDPRSLGDLYLPFGDKYYLNYSYLCGDLGLSRGQVITALDAMARALEPTPQQWAVAGGREVMAGLIEDFEPLTEEEIARVLKILVELVDVAFGEIPQRLPQAMISRLTLVAVARRLGLSSSLEELIEVYELVCLRAAAGGARDLMWAVWENINRFNTADIQQLDRQRAQWLTHWRGLREAYGAQALERVVLALVPLYRALGAMLGQRPLVRWPVAWQAVTFESESLASWLVELTTAEGERSPLQAGMLMHDDVSSGMWSALTYRWRSCAQRVPTRPSWTREQSLLVLRFAIERQRRLLMEKLTDLYLRGGGYEAGESKALIEIVMERILDQLALNPGEQKQLHQMGLKFDLLPLDTNVLTGERVDASRWASPTTAYKYVSALLTLEEGSASDLLGMVSERRLLVLEKLLRQLDFHTSVQQLVACADAFGGRAREGLGFWLYLRASGEVGEEGGQWVEGIRERLGAMDEEEGRELLWDLHRWDVEDESSLNPGLFWAMRLVASGGCMVKLARVGADVVRRKPGFAMAALETLEACLGRGGGALSAILQMRRRVRNRKVLKRINTLIDGIANADGMDRDVFLDCSVDTGDMERDASRCFDFGGHLATLRIELDGRISAFVQDSRGRQLRSFPKTAKDSNDALYKEFQSTKRLIAETLAYQARRLEQAMVAGRVWEAEAFLDIFMQHPVMSSLGRRLIWGKLDKQGKIKARFLTTLEGLLGVDGRAVKLEPGEGVVIAHPVLVEERERQKWQKLLQSKGITQPFHQMEREVYEKGSAGASRQAGERVRHQDLYKLVRERGWSTDGGGPWEVGQPTHSYRSYGREGCWVHVNTAPLGEDDWLEITAVTFTTEREGGLLSQNDVGAIVYSEAMRDVIACIGTR